MIYETPGEIHAAYRPRNSPIYPLHLAKLIRNIGAANIPGGAAGAWMLTAIALAEDSMTVKGPVSIWNSDLAESCGISVGQAKKLRSKLAAGWLAYYEGNRHRAPIYFTTIPADITIPPKLLQYLNLQRGWIP